MPATDSSLPVVISWTEKPIAQELNQLIEGALGTLTDSKIDDFVSRGRALGLSEERALAIVAQLLNIHLEEAEEQGRQTVLDATTQDPDEFRSHSQINPEVKSSMHAKSSPQLAPIAYATDTPPPRQTRIVRLGRPLVFEKATKVAADEMSKYRNYKNSASMEMFLVTSGKFVMGSKDPEAPKNEQPCVEAVVSCFYISRFPVTNIQFEQFDPDHRRKRLPATGDHHPVVYISSADAAKFCGWLSRREKDRRYRLPTEAEWEYAARGSTGREYPWGDEKGISTVANFADARSSLAWRDELLDDGFADTSPVGSYPEGMSPFRIEDMSGNVWEWCCDFYSNYRGGIRVNPRGPSVGVNQIIRGGSYKSRYSSLRASSRGFSLPGGAANDIGFRIVCEIG